MGERKAESANARELHRLKELPLAIVAGGMASCVALGISSILEGWGKTHRFYINALPFRCAFCHIYK
jgi:hypothetical protein